MSLTQYYVDHRRSGSLIQLSWFSLQKKKSYIKGDRNSKQITGKSTNKLPYQNFRKYVILKHRNEMKSHLLCRRQFYFPSYYFFLNSLCDTIILFDSWWNHVSNWKSVKWGQERREITKFLVSTLSQTIDIVWILTVITMWIFPS